MKTIDQILKIKAVVLYVLQAFKEGVDYIKLYKILYFAQREYLGNYGLCLLPDSFRARDYGPVPSLTNKVVKIAEKQCSDENTVGLSDFVDVIDVRGQRVFAKKSPNMDMLADMEVSTLDECIEKYKDMDSMDLSEMSHDSAWSHANNSRKDDPDKDYLTVIDIARAGNAPKELVDYIREKQLLKKAIA